MSMHPLYVTGPAKTGHVGTNYTPSSKRPFLSNGTKYLFFVTYTIQPIKCGIKVVNFTTIRYLHKKVSVIKVWKSSRNLCAHMPRSGQLYWVASSHTMWVWFSALLLQRISHHSFIPKTFPIISISSSTAYKIDTDFVVTLYVCNF